MVPTKSIGIWMDYSSANIIDVTTDEIATSTVTSTFSHEVKQEVLSRSEHGMHKKEQQQHADYFKQIAGIISKHEKVLLFGPSNAKVELFNILRADPAFSKIEIEVQDANKMSDNQQVALVKKFFSK